MPRMSGMQLVDELKFHYKSINLNRELKVEEPMYVFLTAYNN